MIASRIAQLRGLVADLGLDPARVRGLVGSPTSREIRRINISIGRVEA
jgi:hypothetical protein